MTDDRISLNLRTLDKSRQAQVTLPIDYTVAELLEASRQNWKLSPDTDYLVRSERLGRQLASRDMVGSCGLVAGDVLEVVPLLEAGA
ncbi:MAG: hypothetical protein HY692_07680 [Cyanobacteria bacterium NC_groundwater_1444_Ag_S-0.65um_54_12]|nr:hypothetical protein [Cyanobacteria bacterium NC_groundwater_1444_Ag_S-0.65um_54_12]